MAILKNVLVLLISLILMAITLEIVLRALGYGAAVYDRSLATGLPILIPKASLNYRTDCVKNKVVTNALGFHDTEWSAKKPANTFRIAVIGDSFVESMQVPLERTFYKVLEGKLNAEWGGGLKFEVAGFGHSGNGHILNYLYLKKHVLAFKPDVVIHAVTLLNDFRDDSWPLTQKFMAQTGDGEVTKGKIYLSLDASGRMDLAQAESELERQRQALKPRPWIKEFARSSVFFAWVKRHFKMAVANLKRTEASQSTAAEVPVDHEIFLLDKPWEWADALQLHEQGLKAIHALVRAHQSRYLVISIADSLRVHGRHRELYKDAPSFDWDFPENFLRKISAAGGWDYLPLTPLFAERAKKEGKLIDFICDAHWNEVGHAWAAEAIFEYFKSHPPILPDGSR